MAYAEKRPGGWTVRVKIGVDPETGKDIYRRISKDPATGKPFETKNKAKTHGQDVEAEIRAGTWIDPKKAETTLVDWWAEWIKAQEVDTGTIAFYDSLWRNHLGPAWGSTALGAIRRAKFTAWLNGVGDGTEETGPKDKRVTRKYAPRTTNGIAKLLSLMLEDAAEEQMIVRNPLAQEGRKRTRGRRATRRRTTARPKLDVSPAEVMMIAVNMYGICGPVGFVRVVLAAWSGMRPGEQAALKRARCHALAARPLIRVDDDEGTTQEYGGTLKLAPPKGGLGRDVLLPPSLAVLLADWLKTNPADSTVVKGPHGDHWKRRQWNERWRPACDGKPELQRVGRQFESTGDWAITPVVPGLEFKGLRRAHNVWMTDDGIAEVARAHRLGHAMSDEMQAAYSIVSREMERKLQDALERRWQEALSSEAWEIISQISPRLAAKRSKDETEKHQGPASREGNRASDVA